MPYIVQSWRNLVDPAIDNIILDLERFDFNSIDGVLNYIITKIILKAYKPSSYLDYERIIGLLECIQMEIYRKKIADMEDDKAYLNGEVY